MKADVAIIGGGLAGASLAMQIRQEHPHLSVVVLERGQFPRPEAAHKVGESTVEIAAHYLSNTIDLKTHLEEQHIRKFGVRYFFRGADQEPFDQRREMGTKDFFPVKSYQVDRGILENHLWSKLPSDNIEALDKAIVRDVSIEGTGGVVRYTRNNQVLQLKARWIVDASGRTGFLRRRHGLQKKSLHDVSATWFRVDCRVDLSNFTDNQEWYAGFTAERQRWFSTNHFMGDGYWIWLIPLPNNRTSVGIVCDTAKYDSIGLKTYKDCRSWLTSKEPELAGALDGALMDIQAYRHISYDAKRVYSPEGWLLAGDAAAFLDPFYSPGGDFVAITNSAITSIISGSRDYRKLVRVTEVLNSVYRNLYTHYLKAYQNQYKLFGNPLVMPVKISWDFAFYWAFIAFFFFQKKLQVADIIVKCMSKIERLSEINTAMQDFFSEWHLRDQPVRATGRIDMTTVPSLWYLNESLEYHFSDSQFLTEFTIRAEMIEAMAAEIFRFAHLTCGISQPIKVRSADNLLGDFLEEIRDGCTFG